MTHRGRIPRGPIYPPRQPHQDALGLYTRKGCSVMWRMDEACKNRIATGCLIDYGWLGWLFLNSMIHLACTLAAAHCLLVRLFFFFSSSLLLLLFGIQYAWEYEIEFIEYTRDSMKVELKKFQYTLDCSGPIQTLDSDSLIQPLPL